MLNSFVIERALRSKRSDLLSDIMSDIYQTYTFVIIYIAYQQLLGNYLVQNFKANGSFSSTKLLLDYEK